MSALSSDTPSSASPGSIPPSSSSSDPSIDRDDQDQAVPDASHGYGSLSGTNGLHLDQEIDLELPNDHSEPQHVIHLSSIEHCMPRSYIRICLVYRLPDADMLPEVERRLNNFIRKTVDAKPYLSGCVVAVQEPDNRAGAVEIHFSDRDFLDYPDVKVRHLDQDEVPYTYEQLDEKGLPPSVIRPDLVSALTESADEQRAPVFRVQANVLNGGLIVSVYLHHCISDGTGISLLVSGSVLNDDFTFDRQLDTMGQDLPSLSRRLDTFAREMSDVRRELSYSPANPINTRQLRYKIVRKTPEVKDAVKVRGRGCVIAFPLKRLSELKASLGDHIDGGFITSNDALQALLWHSMTRARVPSLSQDPPIADSKLLIPINIRNKLKKPLSESYFGAAIDFASVQMPISHLAETSKTSLAQSAMAIRKAINNVDEPYIRQAIALARFPDPRIDVRDLQASNMDRAHGADMYVTSWEKLKCYDTTFEMGLGPPDWVRKPWSKDPGSCIVLPYDERKDHLEVVIQMTECDMARLLEDSNFMGHVSRVID